jgi:hypothetical protein
MVVFIYDRRFFAVDFGGSACEFLLILVDIKLYNGQKMALNILPFCLHKILLDIMSANQGLGLLSA